MQPVQITTAPKQRRVIHDPKLARRQHLHTGVLAGAGYAGVALALYLHFFVQPVSLAALCLFVLFYLGVGCGITTGYHRHFTHKGFNAPTPVRMLLAIVGAMAGQGPVVFWTAIHRMHHEHSDRPGDPHSPNLHGPGWRNKLRGLFHGFIGWTVKHPVPNTNFYVRDLMSDPAIMWVNRRYYLWLALGFALPAAAGGLLTGSVYGVLEGFLWGGLVRMSANHNMYWTISSLSHTVGRRDYAARDLSTNNSWIALPTLGESLHNNHHAFPRAAIFSLHWWQLDIGGALVALLEKLGLATDVCRVTQEEMQQRQVTVSTTEVAP
jgi:stearoyl-CoA desaturase (delta-9 desaturase)